MAYLFVYGTLMMRGGNSYLLDECEYLGPAHTVDRFPMDAGEGVPMVFNRKGLGKQVYGELYKLIGDALMRCDILEGHPRFYRRRIEEFITFNNRSFNAWIYTINYGPLLPEYLKQEQYCPFLWDQGPREDFEDLHKEYA